MSYACEIVCQVCEEELPPLNNGVPDSNCNWSYQDYANPIMKGLRMIYIDSDYEENYFRNLFITINYRILPGAVPAV